MRSDKLTDLLATVALASWPAPLWCIGLRAGEAHVGKIVLVMLLGMGAVSMVLRLLRHRHPGDFGLFFPMRTYPQGTMQSIRVISILLLIFDLGAALFVLHTPLSRTTTLILLLLPTVSAMNLADECWIARRRRLASVL